MEVQEILEGKNKVVDFLKEKGFSQEKDYPDEEHPPFHSKTPSGHRFELGSIHHCGISDCPCNLIEKKKETAQNWIWENYEIRVVK